MMHTILETLIFYSHLRTLCILPVFILDFGSLLVLRNLIGWFENDSENTLYNIIYDEYNIL